MRILHVVTRSHLRGAELSALDLADELDALGHDDRVVALAPAFDGSLEPRLPVLTESSRTTASVAVRQVVKLALEVRRWSPDIVLAHGGTAARATALIPRRWCPPILWQRILQFPDRVFQKPHRYLWRLVASRVDGAIALTPRNAAELARLGFRGPVWQIPNSRRASRFASVDRATARDRLDGELTVAPDVRLLGLVGHLVDQKRPERAIDVLRAVRAAGAPAHLVVAGAGPLHGRLAEAIDRAGMHDHVTMLGARRDVPDILAALDVLLMTSDAEGIPGVIIEAAMVGCPVVSFPFDGADALAHGGLVVIDRPSVSTMADVVGRLLDDETERAALAEQGRAAMERLSTEQTARRYADCLCELVEAGRGAHLPARHASWSADAPAAGHAP